MSQAIATLRAGATPLLPIYPGSFEDVVRLARMSIISGMIRPATKGHGENQETEDAKATEARATMIILQGMELGIPPMQAVQLLAMINGRITAHSEAVPGLLLSKGFRIDKKWFGTEMTDDWGVTCTITRPGGDKFDGTFTVKQAKRAKLWSPDEKVSKRGKGGTTYQADNDASWHKYPDRMLWARALGFAAKDGAADALKGLMVREEMEDMIRAEQARDVTPIKQIAPLEIPDDIPDTPSSRSVTKADDPAQNETNVTEREPDDMLADPDGVIAKIQEDIALCTSAEELSDIETQYEDLLPRLPKGHQKKAKKLFVEAKE